MLDISRGPLHFALTVTYRCTWFSIAFHISFILLDWLLHDFPPAHVSRLTVFIKKGGKRLLLLCTDQKDLVKPDWLAFM